MSNPWVRSTPTVWPQGPGQSPDNLTSLPNGEALALGIVNAEALSLVTPLGDLILPPWKITTGAGSVSGMISRYIIVAEGTSSTPGLWTAGISPTSTSDQSTLLTAFLGYDPNASAALIDQVNASAAATAYYFRQQNLTQLLGNVARYFSILVYNQTGQALSATVAQHSATYVTESYA